MPVAAERSAQVVQRRLRFFSDAVGMVPLWGNPDPQEVAAAHETRLLRAARPALPILNWVGQFARPIMKVPGLGWVTSDPLVARSLLNDATHLSLLSEGGVGHLWAQILGEWVTDLFDGPGHHDLRSRSKDLFTERTSAGFVDAAWGERLRLERRRLEEGGELDVAQLSRVFVGRMVAQLLGVPVDTSRGDEGYKELFATGEELASVALGTTADTQLPPEKVAKAKGIVDDLTRHIDAAFPNADASTVIGRCRELGLGVQETKGLATLLMVAGTETAASAMARMVALLVDTGEQHRLMKSPERLPDAVREALRVTSPAPLIGRSVEGDVEVQGRWLRKGERVMILTWTANNLAGGFRVDRDYLPQNRQLWFGAGRHLCLGAPLARAELTAMAKLVLGDSRPVRIVAREYGKKVLVPAYRKLVIAKA